MVSPIWSSAEKTGGQQLLAQVAVLGEYPGKKVRAWSTVIPVKLENLKS